MSLSIGDKVPSFELSDQHGELFKSETVIGKTPAVVYFYPKDETPGCTAEACSFRDSYEDFKALGAEVIGISSDSIGSHKRFAQRHRLPFILLADSKKKVQRLFKLPKILFGLYTKRITFVINAEGKVTYVHDSLLATSHIKKALKAIQTTNDQTV
ncbi:peroxiredoxin [Flavobacteriaceae bacterium]|nr:peroxiredoxin [Flavobacteriaceae bacterium]MDB9941598.1 peroxiredoxin [Flavobacteriaceae bacterium]